MLNTISDRLLRIHKLTFSLQINLDVVQKWCHFEIESRVEIRSNTINQKTQVSSVQIGRHRATCAMADP